LTLRRAIHHRSLEQRVRLLDEEAARASGFDELVGESPPMRNLYRILGRIADTETSVLVGGETGTGKELVARSLHRGSRRRDGPFVAVNCAAIPPSLMESELFGHVRGAFTDARSSRAGLLVQANGGTLFLDEIGDLPVALQPKLLRVLEEGKVRPIGSDREIAVNARVIAATHQDLQSAVDEGRFRGDLYYRINVITVDLPPLRARGTDILLLAQRALGEFAARQERPVTRLSPAVADKLLAYPWPGNVRELRNAVERAVALATYEEITVEDLPERIRAYEAKGLVLGGNDPRELASLDTIDRRYIEHVLKTVGGNRTEAARILGLDRKTLYRKLRRYERTDGSAADETNHEPDDPR
jgi:two-component system response regulator HydG